jgi:ribosomal 50S subunit-associated protein YjgA (DUF615 family)
MRQSVHEIERLNDREGAHATVEFRSIEETRRMLIADSDPSIERLLADHCARMGFDVDTAGLKNTWRLKAQVESRLRRQIRRPY